MLTPADLYTRISDGFDIRVKGVADDQWGAATPCPDWDVRALVAHLVGTHHMMLSTLGQSHDAPGPDADLVQAWGAARQAVLDAVSDPDTASKVVEAPFGKMPFEMLVGGLLSGDTLFHTWDLARATGQDETLDAEACAQVHDGMQAMDEIIRGPGMFDAKIEPPADADIQTRLLCFGGRQI